MKYVIISPVKNEEKYIRYTLESIVNQSILPEEWIIVDDGSDDNTSGIVKEFTDRYKWIKLYNFSGTKGNNYSSKVVKVFNYGLSVISSSYDFILKLDGDVSFDTDFCKNILNEFKNNSQLGIASGTMVVNGVPEKLFPEFDYTRGATKFYREKCFREIGGIIPAVSWDTLDNAAARAKGWQTKSLPYYFNHYKTEGSRVGTNLYQHYLTGMANGNIPFYFPYFILKCMSKVGSKPYVLGAAAQLVGFINSRYIRKIRPFPEYASMQIRKDQKNFLTGLLNFKGRSN